MRHVFLLQSFSTSLHLNQPGCACPLPCRNLSKASLRSTSLSRKRLSAEPSPLASPADTTPSKHALQKVLQEIEEKNMLVKRMPKPWSQGVSCLLTILDMNHNYIVSCCLLAQNRTLGPSRKTKETWTLLICEPILRTPYEFPCPVQSLSGR